VKFLFPNRHTVYMHDTLPVHIAGSLGTFLGD
jgi:hypothetical protein